MNKKIIISLGIIGLAAAIAIGATTAFFSDTETSTGNLFVAGGIDLKIDNESYYNGELSEETSWGLSDLDGQLFFDFADLKPGDWGEDTVSLHVYDNDAWACVTFDNMLDRDHGCTEPERKAEREAYGAGNATCDGHPDGELSEDLYFVFWADVCKRLGANYPVVIPPALPGDNVFQPECDYLLMEGYASDILPGTTYTLAAPGEINVFTGELDQPLTGSEDYYIGKAWCFGEITEILPDGTVVCDGGSVGNITQTDSLEADITFYAEQSRNNPNFTCVQPTRYTGNALVYSSTGWAGYSCPSGMHVVDGGYLPDPSAFPVAISQAAKPGVGTYPNYSHYNYTPPEEGWVVQNGNTGQTLTIWVDCI